jgi:ankyrin repeat protein
MRNLNANSLILGIILPLCLIVALGCNSRSDLFVKASLGDRAAFDEYLRQGLDVNQTQGDKTTLLHAASRTDNYYMVETLLGKGAKVNITDIDSITPVMLAANFAKPVIVRDLISHGADVKMRDVWGNSSVWYAVGGNPENIYLLVKAGADASSQNKNGETPLLKAIDIYKTKGVGYITISTLMSLGATINCTNSDGETPTSLAIKYGDTNLDLLLFQIKPRNR